jgi:hypothetical protein
MHSITNADLEFDFNESFWRYEVSLARLHGADTANIVPKENNMTSALPSAYVVDQASETSMCDLRVAGLDLSRADYTSSNLPTSPSQNTGGVGSLVSFDGGTGPLERLQNMFDSARSRAASPATHCAPGTLNADGLASISEGPSLAYDMYFDSFADFDLRGLGG